MNIAAILHEQAGRDGEGRAHLREGPAFDDAHGLHLLFAAQQPFVFKVGGTLNVGANQAEGTYVGTFTVDIPQETEHKGPVYAHVPWTSPTLPWVTVAFHGPSFREAREQAALDTRQAPGFRPGQQPVRRAGPQLAKRAAQPRRPLEPARQPTHEPAVALGR